jgi:ATP-dependent Lhr-like helicase
MFFQELARATKLPPTFLEEGLSELIALGRATCDSFSGLRWLIVPASKRRTAVLSTGRWSLLSREASTPPSAEFVARRLLQRTGVVFRKTLAREKQPLPWRDVARVLRTLEARGEVRGGRFVAGFDGEQYALPDAITLLRAVRRRGDRPALAVSAADPLNFRGILTPHERVAPTARTQVRVA